MIKRYSELILIDDYLGRYNYLKLGGLIGKETFGSDRYLNQALYRSPEWKSFRTQMILRDAGCDMGFPDFEINGKIILHHINPISKEDIINRSDAVFDPENVICVSHLTHEAIHYGDESLIPKDYVARTPNDTIPWRT